MKLSAASRIIILSSEAKCSDFVRQFWASWCVVDPSVRAAVWNIERKHFEFLSIEDYCRRALTLPGGALLTERATLDTELRGKIEWVIIPEFFPSELSIQQMVEVDMIRETRRLGAKSGFIFHGANGLRSSEEVVHFAYERYMRGLLLADAILPVSRLAADQINRFLVNDQKAEYIPFISKIAHPVDPGGGGTAGWSMSARPAAHSRVLPRLLAG